MRHCEMHDGVRIPRRLGAMLLAGAVLSAACGSPSPADDAGITITSAGASQHSDSGARAAVTARLDAQRRTAIVSAVQAVSPAVVSINVVSRQRVAPRTPWDMFFVPQGSDRLVQSFGTGIIARPDGVVITNQHVVAGAQRIVVTLADGRDLPGRVMGEDPVTDIAVVKIEGRDFPVARLGRSTDLMTGEWVVALGNPYAYMLGNSEPTVTVGVVSATGRNILPTGDQAGLYLDMIQTDAAINPGNSGGPLTNALGEVIGVNSSIFSSSGGSVGLGFAIPIERALRVADEIIKNGSVRRAWVGLEIEEVGVTHRVRSGGRSKLGLVSAATEMLGRQPWRPVVVVAPEVLGTAQRLPGHRTAVFKAADAKKPPPERRLLRSSLGGMRDSISRQCWRSPGRKRRGRTHGVSRPAPPCPWYLRAGTSLRPS